MKLRTVVLFSLVLGGMCWNPVQSMGEIFLFPGLEEQQGLIGPAMSGAQVALASGLEGLGFNPAGIVKEDNSEVMVGAAGFKRERLTFADDRSFSFRGLPTGFSIGTGAMGTMPRVALGFFVNRPISRQYSTRLDIEGTGTSEGIPKDLLPDSELDLLFPGGLEHDQTSTGFARFDTLSFGMGVGLRLTSWARFGAILRQERIEIEQQIQTSVYSSATDGEQKPSTIAVNTNTSWLLDGIARRQTYWLGLQMDFGSSISVGVVTRSASQHQNGAANTHFIQSGRLVFDQPEQSTFQQSHYVEGGGEQVPFRLDTPREVHIGAAVRSDATVIELDWVQIQGLGDYEVVPGFDSAPPSTVAVQIDPITTSSKPANKTALGVGLVGNHGETFLFGIFRETSGVPKDDFLFRRVDWQGGSAGVFWGKDAFSGLAKLEYRIGTAPGGKTNAPGSEIFASVPAELEVFALSTGFSYFF